MNSTTSVAIWRVARFDRRGKTATRGGKRTNEEAIGQEGDREIRIAIPHPAVPFVPHRGKLQGLTDI